MKTLLRISLVGFTAIIGLALFSACSPKQEIVFKKDVDVAGLTEQLKSEDKDKRIEACTALAEGGPYAAAAVPALIQALKDEDLLVRSLAAYALGLMGEKAAEAVPALKELLNEPSPEVTPSVINALRAIDPKAAEGLKWSSVSGETQPAE